MNTGLPVYIPNAQVCHMPMYNCCTHRTGCRIYSICAQIRTQTVCKRDCPSCTYVGCSLPMPQRQSSPVYVQNVIQENRLDLNLEGLWWQQHDKHRAKHRQQYVFYNKLFGDYKERRNAQNRARYWRDPEHSRWLARESYRRHHVAQPKKMDERFMPECRLQCSQCPHPDCILPADWRKKAYDADFIKRHPDYFQRYREEHHAERIAYNRQYYNDHKDERRSYQKAHRQKPQVKAKRAEYDKAYRQTPAGKESQKRRRAKYYAAHREEINAKRREKRNGSKYSTGNPSHREV